MCIRDSQETAQACRELGVRAVVLRADVADAAACDAMVAQVLEQLGRLDILVNNAGITRDGLMLRMPEADWDAVLDTNLKGAFHCMLSLIHILLVRQVQSSVYLEDTIRAMAGMGVDTIVEIGPGKALSAFVKKTEKGIKTYAVETVEDIEKLCEALKGEQA